MIAKVCRRGQSASGLLRYLTGDSKAGHVVLDDADVQRLNAPSAQRPDIERPIWHAALSLPEGEHLDVETWRVVAAEFLERMGLGWHEWSAVVHNETGHQHCHVVANRIGYSGQVWAGEWDGRRAIEAAKALEFAHGLTVEAHRPTGRAGLSQAEIGKALRTETQPTRTTLQQLIDQAVGERCVTAVFLDNLKAAGVGVVPNIASTGRVSGLAFTYNGETFKGSELGKAFSWGQLQRRINYEQERDRAALQDCARNREGGAGPGPSASRCDSGRTGRTGQVDARHYEPNVQGSGAGGTAYQNHPRHRSERGKDTGCDSRDDDRDGSHLASACRSGTCGAGRAVSALARSRGPIRGSRQRISGLAAALLARLDPVAPSHDRHPASSNRDNQPVAPIPGRATEWER